MKKWKKITIIVVSVILSIILALVGAFLVITYIGETQFHQDDTHISADEVTIEDEDTISYNGKKYTLNKNIVSFLVMGIDRDNVNENFSSGANGQADVIFVATIDTETKKACIIPISRETMVDVNLFTKDGKYAGTKREQLCLAYAYGNSTEQSSENVLTSVRRLLYNINISSYVTIEMEGVEKLTDLVGGVDITSLEDLNSTKLTLKKGQKTTLNGNQAHTYIAYRDDDVEANARRMERQKQFLSALLNKTSNQVLNDYSKLVALYSTMTPYFNSDISFAQIAYLAQNCLSINFGDAIEYKSIDGTLTEGEQWIEFEADKESILQTVIDVFYIPQ
ncbi:MAG: LCP family protein [Clostridia bacterium]|nr:LCP family protein [Clostridia bacterium]